MLNSRSTPWLFKICLLVSLSRESRAASSIRGRCVTFRFSGGWMVANVSSSLAVALDVSEILSSNDLSSGDSFLMSDSRVDCFEIVEKRIARAHVGSGYGWRFDLLRARFKIGVTRQDPNRSKRDREASCVFHRFPRTPDAPIAKPILAERPRVGHGSRVTLRDPPPRPMTPRPMSSELDALTPPRSFAVELLVASLPLLLAAVPALLWLLSLLLRAALVLRSLLLLLALGRVLTWLLHVLVSLLGRLWALGRGAALLLRRRAFGFLLLTLLSRRRRVFGFLLLSPRSRRRGRALHFL